MRKVKHIVIKGSRDGSRMIVSYEDGAKFPFSSRLVNTKDWFDVIAPCMNKTCLVASVNHAQGITVWEEVIYE